MSHYGMNLYRGCHHGCVYCDGRAEGYYTLGDFDKDVYVKTNATDVLRRELDPARKRKPMKRSFIMLGGGVGDSYQPIESKYRLTRGTLELIREYSHHVHVLTKSTLVTRDLDILKEINRQSRAIVSFSFSSIDESISRALEPGVPSPSQRLETLALFKNEGIACGMFLLPVVPEITDTDSEIDASLAAAKNAGAHFVIFGGMTMKDGRQKAYFYHSLKNEFPGIWDAYRSQALQVVQLTINGPQIGTGDTHSLEIQLGGTWEDVQPMAEQVNGNNLHRAILRPMYDTTGAKKLGLTVTTNVASI